MAWRAQSSTLPSSLSPSMHCVSSGNSGSTSCVLSSKESSPWWGTSGYFILYCYSLKGVCLRCPGGSGGSWNCPLWRPPGAGEGWVARHLKRLSGFSEKSHSCDLYLDSDVCLITHLKWKIPVSPQVFMLVTIGWSNWRPVEQIISSWETPYPSFRNSSPVAAPAKSTRVYPDPGPRQALPTCELGLWFCPASRVVRRHLG